MRSCVICGSSLEDRRSDARYCGGPCRAEGSRLRRILEGEESTYASVRERIAAFSQSHPLGAMGCRDLGPNQEARSGQPVRSTTQQEGSQ
jgi:hypothetical protein